MYHLIMISKKFINFFCPDNLKSRYENVEELLENQSFILGNFYRNRLLITHAFFMYILRLNMEYMHRNSMRL